VTHVRQIPVSFLHLGARLLLSMFIARLALCPDEPLGSALSRPRSRSSRCSALQACFRAPSASSPSNTISACNTCALLTSSRPPCTKVPLQEPLRHGGSALILAQMCATGRCWLLVLSDCLLRSVRLVVAPNQRLWSFLPGRICRPPRDALAWPWNHPSPGDSASRLRWPSMARWGSPEPAAVLRGHTSDVQSVCFSSDGVLAATGHAPASSRDHPSLTDEYR